MPRAGWTWSGAALRWSMTLSKFALQITTDGEYYGWYLRHHLPVRFPYAGVTYQTKEDATRGFKRYNGKPFQLTIVELPGNVDHRPKYMVVELPVNLRYFDVGSLVGPLLAELKLEEQSEPGSPYAGSSTQDNTITLRLIDGTGFDWEESSDHASLWARMQAPASVIYNILFVKREPTVQEDVPISSARLLLDQLDESGVFMRR